MAAAKASVVKPKPAVVPAKSLSWPTVAMSAAALGLVAWALYSSSKET